MQAKRLLTEKGVYFEEISVAANELLRAEIERRSGRRTVPQIWIEDDHVGGCDELYGLEMAGQLDRLLESQTALEA